MILGFISDAHGNIGAFEQGLKLLEQAGCDEVFFLGDAVGYIPDADLVKRINSIGLRPILGNHEVRMLQYTDVADETIYQLHRCRKLLSPKDIEAIANWPEEHRIVNGNTDIWMMHGSPNDLIFGYVYPDTNLDIFDRPSGSITIMGNTHRPFWRCNLRGAWFLNPGSCGMPRDCGNLGSVAVLDTKNLFARILRFDIRESTNLALTRCTPVHESVIALFERVRPQNLIGNIYDT